MILSQFDGLGYLNTYETIFFRHSPYLNYLSSMLNYFIFFHRFLHYAITGTPLSPLFLTSAVIDYSYAWLHSLSRSMVERSYVFRDGFKS